jgi:Transposase IS66 family
MTAGPDAIWPGQVADALRGLIHAANAARDQALAAVPAETTAEHLKLFRRGITVGLSEVRRVPGAKSKQPPARTLLECLRHREADVLRFLTDTAISPASNQAERDLRPSKTQQKISGRLCSEKTTRDRYAIRGYASTAVKHGIAVSPSSATPSPETRGYRQSPRPIEPHPKPATQRYIMLTQVRRPECLHLFAAKCIAWRLADVRSCRN